MAKIVRYCKMDEEHFGENVFDCSRPNVFGNPYTHIKSRETRALVVVETRDKAIDLYDPYFDRMVETNEQFSREFDRLYEAFNNFDTIYLGCYCEVGKERCHTEIIEKKLMKRIMKDKIRNIMSERNKNINADSLKRKDCP